VGSHRADSSRPGCDVGIGVSLFSWKRLSWVAVLGSKTVGVGVAWRAYSPTPQFPHVIAVALGLVSSHDSSGIDRHPYPALGATLSFGGKQPEDPQ